MGLYQACYKNALYFYKDDIMDKLSMFASDSAAMSCLVMYRMGGLRHVLLYLHDMLRQFLPVVRINALFCTPDGGTIISMSDTSTVNVSNKYSVAGRLPPLVDREHITDDVVLRDLRPYQKPEMLKDKRNEDVPYLHHRALMRLPLFGHQAVRRAPFARNRPGRHGKGLSVPGAGGCAAHGRTGGAGGQRRADHGGNRRGQGSRGRHDS